MTIRRITRRLYYEVRIIERYVINGDSSRLDPTGKLPADATRTNFEMAIKPRFAGSECNVVAVRVAVLRRPFSLSLSLEKERNQRKPDLRQCRLNANCCSISRCSPSAIRVTGRATETEKDDETRNAYRDTTRRERERKRVSPCSSWRCIVFDTELSVYRRRSSLSLVSPPHRATLEFPSNYN